MFLAAARIEIARGRRGLRAGPARVTAPGARDRLGGIEVKVLKRSELIGRIHD